jgi:hypothetical protein
MGGGHPGRASWFVRSVAWARAHPVWAITLSSPVIPELLSGSTPLALVYVDPLAFAGLVLLEMALYGSGVLLVREAVVRWRKGWATALLLALAYAILEEGFTTILFPHAVLLASPPLYGRWMGINWIWAVVILQLHTAYSIGAQVLLFHLAFPELRGKSLLSDAAIARSILLLLGADAAFMALSSWVPPFPLSVIPLFALLVCLVAARLWPSSLPSPTRERPRWTPAGAAALGSLFGPCLIVPEGVTIAARLPAAYGVAAMVLVGALFLALWSKGWGRTNNGGMLLGWLVGMLVTDALWGAAVDPLGVPLELVLAFPLFYGLQRLWRATSIPGGTPRPGISALAPPSLFR